MASDLDAAIRERLDAMEIFVALFLVIMAGLLALAAIGVWRAVLG